MTSKAPKELNPENNPIKADIIKLIILLQTGKVQTVYCEWITHKLNSILEGKMKWNESIEDIYNRGYLYKQPDLFS